MTPVVAEARRAVGDVAPLVEFRLAGLRGHNRSRARAGLALVLLLTVVFAVVPAFVEGAEVSERVGEIILLLPTMFLAFMVTTAFALIGAAGGRELLPREQAAAFPVSPTTDHLGALLLAPLNIAWLMQAWSLLAVVAYANGSNGLPTVQLTVLLWLLTATALAQVIAWAVEWVRRGPFGATLVRLMALGLTLGVVGLVSSGSFTQALDQSPTVEVAIVAFNGRGGGSWDWWLWGTMIILVVGLAAVVVGAWLSHAVAGRQARDEARAEGRTVLPRALPRTELGGLVRTDRSSVWRSVPLRRGFFILAALPGMVAAAGQLSWDLLPVMPGLVAAGGALLFGVNAWCLDGTGALWRDSLPVKPELVFAARVWVLVEMLLIATVLTLLIAALRADRPPTSAELTSVVATAVVVSLQVVARSMTWSVRRPYAMDLRSARGTPAPPLAMVGYSAYLALTSTLTGLLFGLTAHASDGRPAVLVAVPLVLLALHRLVVTAREWSYPDVRSRVICTVSAR